MARRYAPVCRRCARADAATTAVASSPDYAHVALRSRAWACPGCGGADFDLAAPRRLGEPGGAPAGPPAARIPAPPPDPRRAAVAAAHRAIAARRAQAAALAAGYPFPVAAVVEVLRRCGDDATEAGHVLEFAARLRRGPGGAAIARA